MSVLPFTSIPSSGEFPAGEATTPAFSVQSRATVAAGWILTGSLVSAPWAFGSRPYLWSGLLAAQLFLATCLWLYGLRQEHRQTSVPGWIFASLGLILALLWGSFFNPCSVYEPVSDRFLPDPGFIPWFPTTVDAANSLPDALCLTALLVTLPAAIDLCAAPIWRARFIATMAFTGLSVIVFALFLKADLAPTVTAYLVSRPWAHGEIFGPMDYHGNAGAYLNLVLPAMAVQAATAVHAAHRFCWIAAIVLGCMAALINTSRAGLVLTGLVIVPAMIWIIRLGWSNSASSISPALGRSPSAVRYRLAALVLIIAIGATTVLLTQIGSKAVHRLDTLRSEASVPWYPRRMQYGAAWEMAQTHPSFGNGLGSYRLLLPHSSIRGIYFARPYQPGQPYTVLGYTHNDYLQTLVEWGWTGTAAWVALIAGLAVKLGRSLLDSCRHQAFTVAAAGALSAVLAHAAVDCPLQIPALQLYVVVFLAFACSCGLGNNRVTSHPQALSHSHKRLIV